MSWSSHDLTVSMQNYKGEENSPKNNWCRVIFCYLFTRWCLNPIVLTVNLVSSLISFAFQLTVIGGRNRDRRWQYETIRIEVKTLITRTCASQLLLIIRNFIVVCENYTHSKHSLCLLCEFKIMANQMNLLKRFCCVFYVNSRTEALWWHSELCYTKQSNTHVVFSLGNGKTLTYFSLPSVGPVFELSRFSIVLTSRSELF